MMTCRFDQSIELKLRDLADYDNNTDIKIELNPMTCEEGEIYGVKNVDNANILLVEITRKNKGANGLRIIFNNTEEDIIIDEARKLRNDLLKLV